MSQISVIVPVYNVERYLKRCVDSILNQTFTDFDLILVDDGSPDRCPQFCDDIAKSDGRVTVIHQKNGGLSAARNAGIEWALSQSNSQWITFVDSDDWIHPRFLESNIHFATKYGVEVCMSRFLITGEYSGNFEEINEQDFAIVDTAVAFKNEVLDPNSACGRLFSKELFSEIRFPVGKLHEDRFTTYKVLFQFKHVGVIDKPMYFYYVNPEGIVRSDWSIRKLDDLEATEQQLDYFQKRDIEDIYLYVARDYIHLLIFNLRNLQNHPEYANYFRLVRKKLRKTLRNEKKKLGLSFHKDFNTYKYAYPLWAKIYRRLWMR